MQNTEKHIVVLSSPWMGHANQLLSIAKALTSEGNGEFPITISFVMPGNGSDWAGNSRLVYVQLRDEDFVREKNMWDQVQQIFGKISIEDRNWKTEIELFKIALLTYDPLYTVTKKYLRQNTPDLCLIDRSFLAAIDAANDLKIPVILQSPIFSSLFRISGSLPHKCTGYTRPMTLNQKIHNIGLPLILLFNMLPLLYQLKKNRSRQQCSAGLRNLYRRFPILVGSLVQDEFARAYPPNVKVVGPIMNPDRSELSPDLEKWFESADANSIVIYISFGTIGELNQKQVDAIVEAFLDQPFRVLWSLSRQQQSMLKMIPHNFRIESWIPQAEVLRHPAVDLVICHCGISSINEALHFGKPILGIPFFSDHHFQAARIIEDQCGIILNKNQLTAGGLGESVRRLASDPVFKKNAVQKSRLIQSANGLQHAVDFIRDKLWEG